MLVKGNSKLAKVRVKWNNSNSAAVFCSRAHQQARCVTQWQQTSVCVCMHVCVLQHTCLSFTPIHPTFCTWHFHIDNSDLLVGLRNHKAAAGRDKNGIYFPPKHFSVKRQPKTQKGDSDECQVEPCGAHCYTADERFLKATCKDHNTAGKSQWMKLLCGFTVCCFFWSFCYLKLQVKVTGLI